MDLLNAFRICFFYLVLTSMLLQGCNSGQEKDIYSGEIYSLNGEWKFYSLFGEGSNYRTVSSSSNDIIIDNSDSRYVEISGNWKTNEVASHGSESYGKDYLSYNFKGKEKDTYVRFEYPVSKKGYYELFIFYPFGAHLTHRINIHHSNGMDSVYLSQRIRCSNWISLGIFKYEREDSIRVEITADTRGHVVADALMIRSVSPQKVKKTASEKGKVYLTEYDDSHWKKLKVPGHWGMINEYSDYTGKGWYRKEFELPEKWSSNEEERIRLKFEGVYHLARVYLNNKYLGNHQGGFTPFEFDVTDIVKFDDKNVLAVEVNNNFFVGATWNWGGITRDVCLVKNKDARIKYQYMHADPNLETGTAELKLKIRIENNSSQKRRIKVQSDIFKAKKLTSMESELEIEGNSVKEIDMESNLSADEVELWHFDTPVLYNVVTTIKEAGKILHERKDRFGIRKVEVTSRQLILNGEPVRLAGLNRVSDHRYWGSSEPQEIIDLDVTLMKNAGANFMRIMHGTQNKKLIEKCDEEGIMIFEEVNVRELTNPEFTAPDYPLAKLWIKEMIERDINHACIIGWSVGNELHDHYEYVETTINYVKNELDPYRLISCVSNTGYLENESPENDPLGLSDFILQNIYQGNPGKVMDSIRSKWPEKAMFISEFPGERFTNPGLDNDIENISAFYSYFRLNRLYVTGAAMWTYNDYRSSYVQTLESENRAWGIVNAWRMKRRAFYTYQKENSPVHNIELVNLDLKKRKANVKIPIRSREDFPSYTMRNYSLKLTFQDIDGKVIQEELKELPVLQPEDDHWKGEISWSKLESEPYELNLALLSTNGYTRYTKTISFQVPSKPEITTIIPGNRSARILFKKESGAFEHYASYELDGKEYMTDKAIANYIDIDSLENGRSYSFRLIACNDKGISETSEKMEVTPDGNILPPIILKSLIRDNKLIVGYTGEKDDKTYTLRYGTNPANLNNIIRTYARGMMTVDLESDSDIYFQLKRENDKGVSNWSEVREAED